MKNLIDDNEAKLSLAKRMVGAIYLLIGLWILLMSV